MFAFGCIDIFFQTAYSRHLLPFPLTSRIGFRSHRGKIVHALVPPRLLSALRRLWHALPFNLKRLLWPLKSYVQSLIHPQDLTATRRLREFHLLVPAAPEMADLPKVMLSDSPTQTNDPEVSVIVAACDDGVWLDTCLRSVLQQGFEPWECIVVDDASLDDTLTVALRYAGLDSRFRVVRHDRNRGLASTRNSGIRHARGRFVTMLDGDDFLFQNSLHSRWRVLANAGDAAIAGSWCDFNIVPESAGLDYAPVPMGRTGVLDYRTCGGENQLLSTSPMLRMDVARMLGGFDPSFRIAEDFEFWTRMFRNGFTLVGTGTVGVAYRHKRSSMICRDPLGHVRGAAAVYDYMAHPLDRSAVCSIARSPFNEPVPGIPSRANFTRRLVMFLTFAYLTGDQNQIDGVLQYVPDDVPDIASGAVACAVNNALDRHAIRGFSLSVGERRRVRRDVAALLVSAPRGPRAAPPRHQGEIDTSRVLAPPPPTEGCTSQRELRIPRRFSATERLQWDVVLEATSCDGLVDLLTLGGFLVGTGCRVAAVTAPYDDDIRRIAEAEGVQIFGPRTCRAKLVVTSSPTSPRTNADSHVAVCLEPWLPLRRSTSSPDKTIVRADWEARWWSKLHGVQVGGCPPHRASRIHQTAPPSDDQNVRRRAETVLVLRAPGGEAGPDSATFLERYGSTFDFVFGPNLGAQSTKVVVPPRVPVVIPSVKAVVVVGGAVPVHAIATGTPVITIGDNSTSLPEGVYRARFDQLATILESVNPLRAAEPPSLDRTAARIVRGLLPTSAGPHNGRNSKGQFA